jgi:predicted Zn-dependent protease
MRVRHGSPWTLAGLLLLVACDPVSSPTREAAYEFRIAPTDPVFRWPTTDQPVRLWAQPGGALADYVAAGIRTWERQFLYREFWGTLVTDSLTADILVRWDRDPAPEAPLTDDPPVQVCGGLTSIPPIDTVATGELRYAGRIEIRMLWFSGEPSDVANCLARVTAHELGHALGIFSHSPNANDLMALPVVVREPSGSDRATIQVLYHIPPDVQPFAAP